MSLPEIGLNGDDFSDALAYFGAQLAADPAVQGFAQEVWAQVDAVDAARLASRRAARQEVGARAVRDWVDRKGDERIRALRQELGGVTGPRHAVLSLVFPDGLKPEVWATGETQAARTGELLQRIERAEQLPELGRDANEAKIRKVLEEGKAEVGVWLRRLLEANAGWSAADGALSQARDREKDAKAQALVAAGGTLGELRKALGSEEAAYAYTRPKARKANPAEAAEPGSAAPEAP